MSKEPKGIIITERPAFMIVVDRIEQPNEDGYTLLVDVDKMQASIINLTKGGKDSMVKQERVAREGYEEIVEILNNKKANIDAKKEEAVKKAIEEIDEKFAQEVARIETLLEEATEINEIEVPDEEPVTEEVAVAENFEANVSVAEENNTIAF